MTFHILGTMIPTDELIFFRGVLKPPTSDEYDFLVGGFKHFLFSIIYGIIIPID